MKKTALVATAAFALAITGAARAQQAGEYEGQTADGNPVAIDVGVDPNNGDFEVTGASFDFSLLCKKSGDTLGWGWGIGFANGADITNGQFSYSLAYPYAYLPFSMTFQGKNSLKGKVADYQSMFNPTSGYSTPPRGTQVCASKQPFTATFVGAGAKHLVKPGTVEIRTLNSTALVPLNGR